MTEKTTVFTLNQILGKRGKLVVIKKVTVNIICMGIVHLSYGKQVWLLEKLLKKSWKSYSATFIAATSKVKKLRKLHKENSKLKKMNNIVNRVKWTWTSSFCLLVFDLIKINQNLNQNDSRGTLKCWKIRFLALK